MEGPYTSIISKRVKESQIQIRRQKDHKIPSKNDVHLLSVCLNRERNVCFKDLSANFSLKSWVKLSELTIVSMALFNRRRAGESQNILESDFHKREQIDEKSNEELFGSLTEEAKKVAKRYSRMKLRGKKASDVYMLLKSDFVNCIELLLKHRIEVGIPEKNLYLFALPSTPGDNRIKVVNSSKVFAKYSKKCGANEPSSLRGTNLRKHLATMGMTMELNDDMVAELAKFMGHAEKVHREHYRHNTIDREVVKIGKLLEAAQGFEEHDSDNDDSDADDDTVIESAFQAPPKKRTAGQKRTKSDKKHPRNNLSLSSVTNAGSTLQDGRKRRKINEKN